MILPIYRYTTQGKLISLAIDCLGAENMTQPKVWGLRSEAVFGLADFKGAKNLIPQEILP